MRRLTTTTFVLALAALALAATGASAAVKFQRIAGYDDPATPNDLDRVGILKVGPKKATNVLIINPGTSASAAYFRPLASLIAHEADGWQVWAVERRENQLEDQSVVDEAKQGRRDLRSSCSTTTSATSPTRALPTTTSRSPTRRFRSRGAGG